MSTPEEAYEEYFDLVWRAMRRLGVGDDAIDDAVQDVFVVVFRRWGEFRGDSQVKTWVYGIVMRVASTHRRSRRRTPVTVDETVAAGLSDTGRSPFDEASWREASRLLGRVLEGVDDPIRAVFVLVDLEELTVQQAADLLGISEPTARSRLRIARNHVNATFERLRISERRRLG